MHLVSELCFCNNGKNIYGEIYLPSIHSEDKIPIVIMSHGFGGNCHHTSASYAKIIADNNIAVYIFDFIGGGEDVKSDGSMLDMSVLTEASDLQVVLNNIKNLPFIDVNKIYLMGNSQGGFVSTYVGCKNKNDVRAMILLYPAFNIHDISKKRFEEEKPNETKFEFLGSYIGRKYGEDAISFNIYDMMKDFDKKVLIIHGENDDVVPISYSNKAMTIFKNAELFVIKGAEHGFKANEMVSASVKILDFLKADLSLI